MINVSKLVVLYQELVITFGITYKYSGFYSPFFCSSQRRRCVSYRTIPDMKRGFWTIWHHCYNNFSSTMIYSRRLYAQRGLWTHSIRIYPCSGEVKLILLLHHKILTGRGILPWLLFEQSIPPFLGLLVARNIIARDSFITRY